MTADLRRSRAALVSAREEERRRLRRDLHDGLGPTLASRRLHLAALERLLPQDPERAREIVERLRDESRDTVAEVRRLIEDLRPPALDELGLAGAIRSRGGALPGLPVTVTAPEPLPQLPAAVEVALYRIASEALANVARHADAGRCEVTIALAPAEVTLSVVDDGRGIPADAPPGIGLRSMRERAAELSGALRIEPGNPGTRVRVVLPRDEVAAAAAPVEAVGS